MSTNPDLDSANKNDLEFLVRFISHDLRSSIRSITGFSNLALEQLPQESSETSISSIKRIINAGKRMQLLIDSMLDYTRIGQRTLHIEEVDISQTVKNIIDTKKTKYPFKNEIIISPDLTLKADQTLVTILLENLLDNALKFSLMDSGSISIHGVDTPRGRALCVSDHGIGFDMKYSKNIFEPLELLHGGHPSSGIGMGLAIVKRVLDRHNGSIWYESEPNKGSTFYFQINHQKL